MTRDEQISQALQLIAPPARLRSECLHDIDIALQRVDREAKIKEAFRVASSKKGKAAVRRYYAALRRTRNAYNALDTHIKPWFSLAEIAYIPGKPTVIDREIEVAETFLDRPSPPPRREAERHKIAVDAACDLLARWGHKIVATRGGKADRLSRILTGDLTIDLFDHLRESKRRVGVANEKMRAPDLSASRRHRRDPSVK